MILPVSFNSAVVAALTSTGAIKADVIKAKLVIFFTLGTKR